VVLRNQQKVTVIFECHYCLIDIQAWTFIQEIVRRHLLGFRMIIQREEIFFWNRDVIQKNITVHKKVKWSSLGEICVLILTTGRLAFLCDCYWKRGWIEGIEGIVWIVWIVCVICMICVNGSMRILWIAWLASKIPQYRYCWLILWFGESSLSFTAWLYSSSVIVLLHQQALLIASSTITLTLLLTSLEKRLNKD
jgi:hypothetical protein